VPSEKTDALRRKLGARRRQSAQNIVEGCGGPSEAELARFLGMSLRSAAELEYHLLLARDVGLLPRPRHERLDASTQEVKRMLTGLIQKIKGKAK
jgi:four helix bundle protein